MRRNYDNDFKVMIVELLKTGQSVKNLSEEYAIDESTQMTYEPESQTYQAPLILKQGFYSYKYVIKKADGTIDENAICGNFYQTENNYKVLVYYRDLGARYDRLIGIGEGNSVNITN